MAEISIAKIKVRRGTDNQRKSVVLDQGELGTTTDTKRLFVGTGALSGGTVIGAKIHPPVTSVSSITSINSQVGDVVYADNLLYQLTATEYSSFDSWKFIGTDVDGLTIDYNSNNSIHIKDNSITTTQLNSDIAGDGLEIDGSSIRIDASDSFGLSAGKLVLESGSITENEIATTALSAGLQGGNGTPISLKVDSSFGFDTATNTLQLCSVPGGITEVNPSIAGPGLSISDNVMSADIRLVDNTTINLDPVDGSLSLINHNVDASNIELQRASFNEYGVATNVSSSIFSTLTGVATGDSDGVPVGSILPHSNAATDIPSGYLMCNGQTVLKADYSDLYDVIGTIYGPDTGTAFTLPSFNTDNAFLHGSDVNPVNSNTVLDSSGSALPISYTDTNFIIKATASNTPNIFNGFPGQVSLNGAGDNVVEYETIDKDGLTVMLSSAGFITFENGATTRDGEKVDRFAIPVFNY